MRRFKQDNIEKIREVIVFTAVGIFTLSQITVMILCVFNKIGIQSFTLNIVISSSIIIAILNISQIVIYFNLAGSPYKKVEYY